MCVSCVFFFSSRRRHTRCALVTGVQTCALPIFWMATARLIWLLPPGRRVLRRDAARRCWREAPVVADGAADASAARHAVSSGGCAAVAAGSRPRGAAAPRFRGRHRSEEHTSELQSLMRNSYAVFCLKKKTYKINHVEIH